MTALPNPFITEPVGLLPALAPEISEILERAVAASLQGQLTERQVRWAADHDWFLADLGNGLIQIVNRYFSLWSGEACEDVLVWDRSFSELRDWAGY